MTRGACCEDLAVGNAARERLPVDTLVVASATESLTASHGYLRFNRRGVWLFSVAVAGNAAGSKLLRGVTRIDVTCKAQAK